jgi:hypothetical protein
MGLEGRNQCLCVVVGAHLYWFCKFGTVPFSRFVGEVFDEGSRLCLS